MKKLLTLFCGVVIACSLSTAAFSQAAPAPEKMDKKAKQARWEGVVIRSDADKSTLTVRKVGSNDERTIHYDSSTRWVSQEHGSKKVNEIDATQVKDGDRVIATGIWDKAVLNVTLISKRLSHSK